MKNLNPAPYSPEEVMEILRGAKALGYQWIKINGIEAGVAASTAAAPLPPATSMEGPRDGVYRVPPRAAKARLPDCPKCGDPMHPSKRGAGHYCPPCWGHEQDMKRGRSRNYR